ncbi:MAG TPA: ATP-binding protein [Gemmatimonadota bacterium]|jgi:signal transduction histidine kinase/CheY-like chemotaxis protein
MPSISTSHPNVASSTPRSAWRDARRLPAGVAVAVLCIFGMAVLPYWSAARTEALTSELREQLIPLEITVERLHHEVLQIANDIRGLWLTGDRTFTVNYTAADAAVRAEFARARGLAALSDSALASEVTAAEQAYMEWSGNNPAIGGGETKSGETPSPGQEQFASSNSLLAGFNVQMDRTSVQVRAREAALRGRLEEFRRFERVMMLLLGTLASIVVAYLAWLAWALLRAQRGALEERDHLEAVLAAVDSGILVLDSDLHVAVANERAAELLGVPLGELVGSDQRRVARESLGPRLADPGAFEKRATYLDVNPEAVYEDLVEVVRPQPRTLSRYGSAVRDERGRVLGRIEVYRDVTEALSRERELADANERKDRFVATVSHELRTPLTPILGWIELLRDERDPRRVRQGLEAIRRNVQLEAQLVDDLLDLSRVVNQKLELDFQRVDVGEVIAAAVGTVQHLADAKGVRLDVRSPERPADVTADETRLIQVLWNLLSNAIKFTPSGGRVSLVAETPGDRLRVVVEDEGEGIPADFLSHVFKPFEQVTRRHRRRGGLGIGLALAHSLVALHGGEILAESEGPGRGARFTFWIPRHRPGPATAGAIRRRPARRAAATGGGSGDGFSDWSPGQSDLEEGDMMGEPSDGEQEAAARAAAERPPGRSVLVVEDNPDTLEAMRILLESWGCEVTAVDNAPAALAAARERRLDAVVSDIGMPEVDGLAFAAELRKLHTGQAGSRPLLIAITGFASKADRERALAAGFDAFLTKPIDFGSLRELLSRAPAALETQQA